MLCPLDDGLLMYSPGVISICDISTGLSMGVAGGPMGVSRAMLGFLMIEMGVVVSESESVEKVWKAMDSLAAVSEVEKEELLTLRDSFKGTLI